MNKHIKNCELGDNWKDCPACVEGYNDTCLEKEKIKVPNQQEGWENE